LLGKGENTACNLHFLLQSLTGSQDSSLATAFSLAFLSLLLQNCISSFENFLKKEHSKPEQNVANGLQNSTLAHNGLSVEKLSKHESSIADANARIDFNDTKKLKRVLKHRRRRRRRRNIDYSFESYSGSGSDSEESGGEDGDDSDLSEGVGEVDGVLDDLMSDDSDDVYIESESDDESEHTGSLPKTVFSARNGKQPENSALPKSTDMFSSHQAVHGKQALKAGILGLNGISVGKMIRPDLFSDVSDAETGRSNIFKLWCLIMHCLFLYMVPLCGICTSDHQCCTEQFYNRSKSEVKQLANSSSVLGSWKCLTGHC